MSFISCVNGIATINGSAPSAPKSHFDDGDAVQLRRARTEESGHRWIASRLSKVVVKNVLLYDEVDFMCLRWFILVQLPIDLSQSIVSPDSVNDLVVMCETLKSLDVRAASGSVIQLPLMNGYSGLGRLSGAIAACHSIGLETIPKNI